MADAGTEIAGEPSSPPSVRDVRRRVLLLALPALGEQFLSFCVGLYDMFLSGHVSGGNHEVGVYTTTVGISAYISWLASLMFSLVGTGTTALVARSWGAGDTAQANRFAARSITLALPLGFLVYAVLVAMAPVYAKLQNMEGESLELAASYIRTDAIGHLFFGFCLVGAAALRGTGDMRTPLLVLGFVNLLNVLISTTLVFGWGPVTSWGVRGIVIGTVTARICGALIMLAVLWRGTCGLRLYLHNMLPRGEDVQRILRIGIPAALDGALMWSGQSAFLAIIARLGGGTAEKAYTAAHMIGMEAEALTYLPATAWGYAAASLVGQSLGAADPLAARRMGNEAARQAVFVALLGACTYLFGADLIFRLMTGRFLAWYQIALAVLVVYIHALRGAGATRMVLWLNLGGVLCIRLPLAWLLGIVFDLGLIGAWTGMCADVVVRAVVVWHLFRQAGWTRTTV
jgi:multidrug resistance protein, MATE family